MKTLLILLTSAAALLPILAVMLTGTHHSPDFTWRIQWVISNLSLPVWVTMLTTLFAAAAMAKSLGYPCRSGKIWMLGVVCLLLAILMAWMKIRPLHEAILQWNPNWPPPDWSPTRDALYFSYAIFAGLLGVGVVFFTWSLRVNEKDSER